jgi:hypothetical protein
VKIEDLEKDTDFFIQEHLSDELYSLIIFYKEDMILNRATFKKKGCTRYLRKKALYLEALEVILKNKGISIK